MRRLLCLLPLTLAACLDRGEYPSLRPRAFESAGPPGAPVPPPPPAPPARADIVARVAALADRAGDGQRAFASTLASTRAAVAAAGPADSESWITAQEAVSALDVAREATVTAAADLDALNRSGMGPDGLTFGDNDFAAIRAAAARVNDLLQAQQRDLGALEATLASP